MALLGLASVLSAFGNLLPSLRLINKLIPHEKIQERSSFETQGGPESETLLTLLPKATLPVFCRLLFRYSSAWLRRMARSRALIGAEPAF
eukprot:8596034-Prorocentrum_lima.AAC.1